MVGKGRWAHVKHARGWSIADLARYYGVPEAEIVRILEYRRLPKPSRAMPPAEKQRRSEARAAARCKLELRNGPDDGAATAGGSVMMLGSRPRTRRRAGPPGPPKGRGGQRGAARTELVTGQAGVAGAPELVKPAPATWSGPMSPCQTSLKGGRRRIKD